MLSGIVLNFAEDTSSLRLKDIERTVFSLMLYNYMPEERRDILQIFAEELRLPTRQKEINRYPKSFISCINYMACLGFLPADLISTSLQPSMIKSIDKIQNYADIGREVLELDCFLDIESPSGYDGYRLDPARREALLSDYFSKYRLPRAAIEGGRNSSPVATHHEKLIVEVEGKLTALLGGPDMAITTFVLPYISTPGKQ